MFMSVLGTELAKFCSPALSHGLFFGCKQHLTLPTIREQQHLSPNVLLGMQYLHYNKNVNVIHAITSVFGDIMHGKTFNWQIDELHEKYYDMENEEQLIANQLSRDQIISLLNFIDTSPEEQTCIFQQIKAIPKRRAFIKSIKVFQLVCV